MILHNDPWDEEYEVNITYSADTNNLLSVDGNSLRERIKRLWNL